MFRTRIRVNADSDTTLVLHALLKELESSELPQAVTDKILGQVSAMLDDTVPRAQEIARLGSQLTIEREFKGEQYSIFVQLNGGQPESLLTKFLRILGKT